MKKKRGNKSKDRDKGKNDEEVTSRSHRSSRRKRKSSSSSNESTVEDDNQTVETTAAPAAVGVSRRSSRKCVVSQFQSPSAEAENNVGNQRVTRHSKRLAGINVSAVSSDDSKDDSTASVSASSAVESCSSPSKVTGKASPYSNESPRVTVYVSIHDCRFLFFVFCFFFLCPYSILFCSNSYLFVVETRHGHTR